MSKDTTAVLIPCYNEGISIAQVINDFKKQLPEAVIYVYDNNSTDGTAEAALQSGAVVRREKLQGKGNVVRRMFADIDADIYVMVDGDATYDAPSVIPLIKKLHDENLDIVVGCRKDQCEEAYRKGHRLGNTLFTKSVSLLFGQSFTDIFSGYRVFSRRFVKSFPANSKGFEIETELTVHCLQQRLAVGEIDTPYYSRPEGSFSKLSTYKDGWRILKVVADLVISERPLLIFGTLSALFALLALALFLPVFLEYCVTGLVPKLPTLFVSGVLGLFACICLFFGYLYDRVSQTRREIKHFFYLQEK